EGLRRGREAGVRIARREGEAGRELSGVQARLPAGGAQGGVRVAGPVAEVRGTCGMIMRLPTDFAKELENSRTPPVECRLRRLQRILQAVLGVSCILGGVVAFLLHFAIGLDVVFRLKWVPAALVIVGVGLFFIGYASLRAEARIFLFPSLGFVRVEDSWIETCRWHELSKIEVSTTMDNRAVRMDGDGTGVVTSVWVDVPPKQSLCYPYHALRVHCRNGNTFKLNSLLSHFKELATAVQKNTFALHWPVVVKAWTAGTPIPFFELSVD